MRPGVGNTIIILDQKLELKALETGLKLAGLTGSTFELNVFDAGHKADYDGPHYAGGPEASPRWIRKDIPNFYITPENIRRVRISLEETLATTGLMSVITKVKGQKKIARSILDELGH